MSSRAGGNLDQQDLGTPKISFFLIFFRDLFSEVDFGKIFGDFWCPFWYLLGPSWGGHGPSWGQHLGQLEPTWGVLDRLASVGLVLDPFSVRIGFVRFAFVSC